MVVLKVCSIVHHSDNLFSALDYTSALEEKSGELRDDKQVSKEEEKHLCYTKSFFFFFPGEML